MWFGCQRLDAKYTEAATRRVAQMSVLRQANLPSRAVVTKRTKARCGGWLGGASTNQAFSQQFGFHSSNAGRTPWMFTKTSSR